MDGVKAINGAKARMRDMVSQMHRDVAAIVPCLPKARALDFTRGLGSERAYHRVKLPVLDPVLVEFLEKNGGGGGSRTGKSRGSLTN